MVLPGDVLWQHMDIIETLESKPKARDLLDRTIGSRIGLGPEVLVHRAVLGHLRVGYPFHVSDKIVDNLYKMVRTQSESLTPSDVPPPTSSGFCVLDTPLKTKEVRGRMEHIHAFSWGPVMSQHGASTLVVFYLDERRGLDEVMTQMVESAKKADGSSDWRARTVEQAGHWWPVSAVVLAHNQPVGARWLSPRDRDFYEATGADALPEPTSSGSAFWAAQRPRSVPAPSFVENTKDYAAADKESIADEVAERGMASEDPVMLLGLRLLRRARQATESGNEAMRGRIAGARKAWMAPDGDPLRRETIGQDALAALAALLELRGEEHARPYARTLASYLALKGDAIELDASPVELKAAQMMEAASDLADKYLDHELNDDQLERLAPGLAMSGSETAFGDVDAELLRADPVAYLAADYIIDPIAKRGPQAMQLSILLSTDAGASPSAFRPPKPEWRAEDDIPPRRSDPVANLGHFVFAIWRMMDETMPASHRSVPELSRGLRKRARRVGLPEQVTVVTLRREAQQWLEANLPREGGRDWTCQWYVRGHWRVLHRGTKRERRIWIPEYRKGPEDKPLKSSTNKVYDLRR